MELDLIRPIVVDEASRLCETFISITKGINPKSRPAFIRYVLNSHLDEVFSLGELEAVQKKFGLYDQGQRPLYTLKANQLALKNGIKLIVGRENGKGVNSFGFATKREYYKEYIEEEFGLRIVDKDPNILVGPRPEYEFDISRNYFYFEVDGYADRVL